MIATGYMLHVYCNSLMINGFLNDWKLWIQGCSVCIHWCRVLTATVSLILFKPWVPQMLFLVLIPMQLIERKRHTMIFCAISGSNCTIFSLDKFEKSKIFLDLGCCLSLRADGGSQSQTGWEPLIQNSRDGCWISHNTLNMPCFSPSSFSTAHPFGCLFIILVWLSFCLCHMLNFSNCLYTYLMASRGTFFCICWYCPLEIKVESRGTTLIIFVSKRKRIWMACRPNRFGLSW